MYKKKPHHKLASTIKNSLTRLKASTARHAAWMLSGTFVQAGSAFIANAVLARVFLPEDFGQFAIAMANISLVKAVISFPIGTIILRASDSELEKDLELYTAINIVQNIILFLGSILLLIQFNRFDLNSLVLVCSVISSYWVNIETALYERKFPYKKLSLLETFSWLAAHIFSIVGAVTGLGIIVIYLRDLVRQLILVIGVKFLHGLQPLKIRWISLDDWKYVIHTIKGFWANRFLENSFDRIVVLVVGALAGEQGAGYFFQAQRFALLPYQLLSPITSRIAVNYFSHRVSSVEGGKILLKSFKDTLLGLVPFCILMAVTLKPIIPTLFGPGWEPIVPTFIAMLGFTIFSNPFELFKSYFMANAKMKSLIILGRGGQYIGFLLSVLLVISGIVEPLIGLSLGLSISYVFATLLLMMNVFISKKKCLN